MLYFHIIFRAQPKKTPAEERDWSLSALLHLIQSVFRARKICEQLSYTTFFSLSYCINCILYLWILEDHEFVSWRGVKSFFQKGCLNITQNCIKWWDFTSGDLRSVKCPFIAIIPWSTPTGINSVVYPCSPMVQETGIQSQVQSYQRLKKWFLIPPCLTLSIIRYGSRIKWRNPGNGTAPSTTPRCYSYWKGKFGSSSTKAANFTLYP